MTLRLLLFLAGAGDDSLTTGRKSTKRHLVNYRLQPRVADLPKSRRGRNFDDAIPDAQAARV